MVSSVLIKTLQAIEQLLTETRGLNNRYDPRPSVPSPQQRSWSLNIFRSSFDEFEVAVHREQKQKSVKNATRWAIHDADKFEIIVKRLKTFIDGLHDITRSLGVLSDQQARLKEEIESVSDRESLQFIRDAAGQEDIADVARQQLQQSYMASTAQLSQSVRKPIPLLRNARGIPSMDVLAETKPSAGRVSPYALVEPSPYVDTLPLDLAAYTNRGLILPSTPDSFPKLFPSGEILFLQHDNENVDGNLALCVATATKRGCGPHVQLFYLQMEDIKRRKFSVRRHHRDSGQEVCSTNRVYRTKVRRRTRVRCSFSNSMNSLQSISSGRRSSISSQASTLGSSQSGADSSTSWSARRDNHKRRSGTRHHRDPYLPHTCTCCPKRPKKFHKLEELR